MTEKKSLYVTDTLFQIMTVLNMKLHCHPEEKADLLLFGDNVPYVKEIKERIESLGIFEQVYLNYSYLQRAPKGTYSWFHTVYNQLLRKLRLHAFNDNIVENDFNLKNYKDIFIFYYRGVKLLARGQNRFYKIYKGKNRPKIHVYDEGIGSYLTSSILSLERYADIESIYLYNPQMAEFNDGGHYKLRKIPKIRQNDTAFIDLLNFVFDYDKSIELENHTVLFFDQIYRKNTFTKKLYEMLKACNKSTKTIWVKEHPRRNLLNETINLDKKYFTMFDSSKTKQIPWELVLLNQQLKNIVCLTYYSSAVLASQHCIDQCNSEIKTYFLYPLIDRELLGNTIDTQLDHSVKSILEQFEKLESTVSIVDTKEALIRIIIEVDSMA